MKNTVQSSGPASVVPPLLLRQVDLGSAAGGALKLLFCGAGAEAQVAGGVRLFELVDVAAGSSDSPVGAALTVDIDPQTVQLYRFVVHPAFPGKLLAGRLITGVADRLRASGTKSLMVATPSDVEEIGQLWSVGFRKAVADDERLELSL